MTGAQAVQMVKAGLKAIYLSGWQVAADANLAGRHVPRPEPLLREQRTRARQGASTAHSCARTSRLGRGQQRHRTGSRRSSPDAEAGFGGPLNAFELMKG
jgi:isocitrate lyase